MDINYIMISSTNTTSELLRVLGVVVVLLVLVL